MTVGKYEKKKIIKPECSCKIKNKTIESVNHLMMSLIWLASIYDVVNKYHNNGSSITKRLKENA